MSIRILFYNYTYNELKVESDTKQYVYEGVSPYLYDKIDHYIRQRWFGKVWQILRRLKLTETSSTAIAPGKRNYHKNV